jgi:localization factor PodJL
MKLGVPWSVKGIRPEARETAKEAARRSGMSLGDWLNSVILHQAEEDGIGAPALGDDDDDSGGHELTGVHQRLDELTHRIEKFTRTGPAAYAPRNSRGERSRNEDSQIAELIGRLDRRLDQFVQIAPAMAALPVRPVAAPPAMRMPPALDLAVAEIAARQRALNGQQPLAEPRARMPAVAAPALAPVPAQDLSGLEDQLRKITTQIETLRRPGVEEAINALRAELGDIANALTEAMPRQAIDTIEKQIAGLNQRIAEGRQAGIDGGALSGVEHGLAEVRDALRSLTPAENLVGFNDAVAGLAHKIDLIVGQQDPATMHQLENAITTLRDMATHVASTDAVTALANQVQDLAGKVDQMARSAGGSDALNSLEQRIGALSDALAERAQNGGSVPPILESLVQSLSDKIEMIQEARGDNVAVGHLEDRIVSLVQRLDASDSRLGHLEAIERGLADLLVHIGDIRASKESGALRAENPAAVVDLRHDIARTQDALDAVNGTLSHVVDRLVMIENDIRGETRGRPPADAELSEPKLPVGKLAVRTVPEVAPPPVEAPIPVPPPVAVPQARAPQLPAPVPAPVPTRPPAPKRLPPATHLPINPDLPPDQPLEPGSGPPVFRATPAARIAASEAALGGSGPSPTGAGGKSGFIAAARRAAQAAVLTPSERIPRAEPVEIEDDAPPSLRAKLTKRIKSVFIASSLAAIVVGSIQIAGNYFDFGKPANRAVQLTTTPDAEMAKYLGKELGKDDVATSESNGVAASDKPEMDANAAPAGSAAGPLALPKLPGIPALAPPTVGSAAVPAAPPNFNLTTQSVPSLLSPPVLNTRSDSAKSDVTGSIARPAGARAPNLANAPSADQLPASIGGARLRSAAVAGDGAAAYEIGVRFAEGRGVPANLEDAALWFERAAGKGLAPAQFRYASQLEKGQGVKKDLVQARRLYLVAAAKGNAKAMHNLAVLYAEGIDGKPDYATAAQWFRKAAQDGVADSQYNLGVLCARGLGTDKSMTEAYKWFALAAAQGDKESARKRDDVASRLEADELETAENAVKSFVAERQPDDAVSVPAPSGGWDSVTSAPSPAPRAKPRTAGPLSLGSFEVGNR